MSINEVDIFLKGFNKRKQDAWEQTRIIAYTLAQVNSSKPIEITDILRFDWDKKGTSEQVTDKDKERLINLAKIAEKQYEK